MNDYELIAESIWNTYSEMAYLMVEGKWGRRLKMGLAVGALAAAPHTAKPASKPFTPRPVTPVQATYYEDPLTGHFRTKETGKETKARTGYDRLVKPPSEELHLRPSVKHEYDFTKFNKLKRKRIFNKIWNREKKSADTKKEANQALKDIDDMLKKRKDK